MNLQMPIEKLEKAAAIAQSMNKKIWKLRAGGHTLPSVDLILDSERLAKFLNEAHTQFLAEQEDMARVQEALGNPEDSLIGLTYSEASDGF